MLLIKKSTKNITKTIRTNLKWTNIQKKKEEIENLTSTSALLVEEAINTISALYDITRFHRKLCITI
jgi:hypothetical protein